MSNDDDTQKLPDISHLVNALSTDYPPAPSPVEQALHWAQNNGGIMPAHVLKAAVLGLTAENEALKAALKPFADCAAWFKPRDKDDKKLYSLDNTVYSKGVHPKYRLTVGDFRTAARALKVEDGA